MRIVRWGSQERVDQPDLTQVSFQTLGEFRRFMRGVLLGPGSTAKHPNYVIRGFAVEPESPASSRVVVKIDPGGGNPLSFAVGAENQGGGIIDHGQLIGGDDSAGNVEGNAEITLDFTGQPNATYTVEMRFVYSAGANDNRAFWNDAGNTEFIAAHDTRFLPVVELRLSGSASDEWIPLAEVTWGGSTIDAGDIADVREFAFEGSAPYVATSATGAGGIPDFDRSATRDADGLNEVYPALRALARQIRDLKGPNEDGEWAWFTRPHELRGAGSAFLPAGSGYTLAGSRTVDFTVGDVSLSSDADFTGATALDDCLQHIEAVAPTLSATGYQRIRVLLKSGGNHIVTTPITIAQTMTLEVLGGGSGTGGGSRTLITPDADWGITLSGGRLILRDLYFTPVVGNKTAPLFDVLSSIDAYNCYFGGDQSPAAWSGTWTIDADATGSRFERCAFAGAAVTTYAKFGSGDPKMPCVFEQCTFADSVFSASAGTAQVAADRILMRGITATQAVLHGANSTPVEAMFDLRGSQDSAVEGLLVDYDKRLVACVLGGRQGSSHTKNLHIGRSRFRTTGQAAPAAGAGEGGALGTGWAISIRDSFSIQNDPVAEGITVDRCRFEMAGLNDAGSVQLIDSPGFSISRCKFEVGVSAGLTNVWIEDSSNVPFDNINEGSIYGCAFWAGQSGALGGATFRHVLLDNASAVRIRDCGFYGEDMLGNAVTGYGAESGGVVFLSSNAVSNDGCYEIVIDGCKFRRWPLTGTDDGHAIRCLEDDLGQIQITGCQFTRCDGYSIDFTDAAVNRSITIERNQWIVGTSNTERCVRFRSAGLHLRWDHNTVQGTVGSIRTLVEWGTQPGGGGYHSCIGNVGPNETTARVSIVTDNSLGGEIAGMDSVGAWEPLNKGLVLSYTVIA